jgi:hypothetical protein
LFVPDGQVACSPPKLFLRLELHHRQAGDLPKVTDVEGGHGVVQMQRGRADQQILKRKLGMK